MFRTFVLCVGGVVAAISLAHAEPKSKFPAGTVLGKENGRLMVVTPDEGFTGNPAAEVSNVIWVNRCVGGCTVTGGNVNDALNHIATYIGEGPHVMSEFKNDAGQSGAAADAEWNAIVTCMKEIYSPFNVVVTETKPATGLYTEAIIAGDGPEVGIGMNENGTILGVAPAHSDCVAHDNAISFTFANNPYFSQKDSQWRVWELCATAGQESAHLFGLDHAYEYFDGQSACNDPMTYRTDCGGEKFFRNKPVKCGESAVRNCMCASSQNSHAALDKIFGAGTSLIPPPSVMIDSPKSGTINDGQVIAFKAGSKRGVSKSVLYLNGWKWGEVAGAKFGANGQLNPAAYTIALPAGVPNGVIDIKIVSYDDLELVGESTTVTVTKGSPCASADQCATGQKCDAGKCFWDAPAGKLGDTCEYEQFCTSNVCVMTDEGGYCSQNCILGSTGACPMGFECLAAGTGGACLPISEGGCCSASTSGQIWVHGAMSALVLGFVVRRRRRR